MSELSNERLAELQGRLTEQVRLLEHRLAKSAIPEDSWEYGPTLDDAKLKLALITELQTLRQSRMSVGAVKGPKYEAIHPENASAVEMLSYDLAVELEQADIDRNDLVTINRKKLTEIAQRVLARVSDITPSDSAAQSAKPQAVTREMEEAGKAVAATQNSTFADIFEAMAAAAPATADGEAWQCECGCRTKADIQRADGSLDGRVRCVDCKAVSGQSLTRPSTPTEGMVAVGDVERFIATTSTAAGDTHQCVRAGLVEFATIKAAQEPGDA